MRIKKILLILPFLLVSIGCSNLKTYPKNLAKNVFIKTKTESGSAISSVKARMDIHDVDAKCELKYLGTVKLDKKKKKVGLKGNNVTYLDFVFLTSGFFSSSSSATRFSTAVKIRKNYIYNVLVSYIDDIYDVEIWEKRSKRAKGHEIRTIPLHECGRL